MEKDKQLTDKFILFIIFIGLTLRLYKISYGLPSISHEEFSTLGNVWSKELINSYNPAWFSWPSLLFYIEMIILKVLKLLGSYDWTNFIIVSRIFQAVVGTLTILLVYLIAKKLYNHRTGILASFLTAIFTQHIIYSQLSRPEVLVPFFYLLVIFSSIFILKKGRFRFYILASVFSGLAISSKYNGIFSIFIPIFAHILRNKKGQKVKSHVILLSILLVIPILTFLLTNPYSIFDYKTFINGVNYQASRTEFDIYKQISKTVAVNIDSLGPILFGISILSIINHLTKSTPENKFVIVTYISTALLILIWNPSSRLLLTNMLILVILSSNLLSILFIHLQKQVPKYLYNVLSIVFILLVSLSFIYQDIILVKELSRKSITDTVSEWLSNNAPYKSKIFWGYEAPIPYLTNEGDLLFETEGDIEPHILFENNYSDFKSKRYDFIILTGEHTKISQYDLPESFNFYKNFYQDYFPKIFKWDRNNLNSYSAPFSQFFRSQRDYIEGTVYIYKKLN